MRDSIVNVDPKILDLDLFRFFPPRSLRTSEEKKHCARGIFSNETGISEEPEIRSHRAEVDRRIRQLGDRALPEYPGSRLVPDVTVPPPVQLRPEMDPVDRVRMLGSAHRSTFTARYPDLRGKNNFMCFGSPLKHPLFDKVLACADHLLYGRIPPLSWVLFSFDVWKRCKGSDGRPPSAKWILSPNRAAPGSGSRQWFEAEREEYCRHRVVLGPKHRELLQSWEGMWRELRQAEPTTRADVWDVIYRHFPGDAWRLRVAAAKGEALRLQQQIDRTVAEGGLWQLPKMRVSA